MSELLDVTDVARFFKRSKDTIRRWVAEGVLPPPDRVLKGRPYWTPAQIGQVGKARAPKGEEEKE